MANEPNRTAAATQPKQDVVVEGRVAREPQPVEKVTNDTPIPAGDVTGFRVSSEAAQEGSDVGPVTAGAGDLAGATRVKNSTLRKRDEAEFRRRGVGPGAARTFSVSASFEGLMMVENGLSDPFPVSGSYTGPVGPDGLVIRPLTAEEEEKHSPVGVRLNRREGDAVSGGVRTSRGDVQASGLRADDLSRGSGAGGGGNPQIAGQSRGVANPANTGGPVGKATTSVGNTSGPQGGGSDTRKP